MAAASTLGELEADDGGRSMSTRCSPRARAAGVMQGNRASMSLYTRGCWHARKGGDGCMLVFVLADAGMILGAERMSEEKQNGREWRRGRGLAGLGLQGRNREDL